MGANAQTTVPTFTAGEVLTAAQQNNSARTGVPVFATTITRDAGFGGTGEKTLAEGQLCYVEGTGLQSYNGTSWVTWGTSPSSGAVLQVKGGSTTTTQTSTSATYADVGLSVSITPTSASNKVLVFYNIPFDLTRSSATNTGYGNHRLVRGSTTIWQFDWSTNSLRYAVGGFGAGSTTFVGGQMSCVYLDSPATTSATTYKAQFATQDGTLVVNGNPGTTSGSQIIVMEVTP